MRTYLTPIRGDSEFEHCSTALPYHRSPIPFGSVLYTSKKTSVRFSRLRAEPTRSSAVSCIHAHRLHRVDGHCTLNKAAGVNCTGFNERRSAHPSIRPLEWRPLSTVFNRRRFLNYWEHFSWNRPPTRGVPWNLLNELWTDVGEFFIPKGFCLSLYSNVSRSLSSILSRRSCEINGIDGLWNFSCFPSSFYWRIKLTSFVRARICFCKEIYEIIDFCFDIEFEGINYKWYLSMI